MRTLGQPVLFVLANAILAHQRRDDDALERANRGIDLAKWLIWFAGIALEAQRRSIAQGESVTLKTKLLDRLHDTINALQKKAHLHIFEEGIEGFKVGLSAGNCMTITGVSPATANRDLAGLVERVVLVHSGELQQARCALGLQKV